MSGGGAGDRKLGLGGTQLMEQMPLGTPEPAPPRAAGTQLIGQVPPQAPDPNAVPLYGAPPPPQAWPPPDAPQMPPQPPQSFDFANAVPAYGIPPDAFRNQPPPQAPPPVAPQMAPAPQGYANPYAQGVQNAYGTYTGTTGDSSGTSDALMPRLKGGGILLLGLALLGFNAVLLFTQDYFYPKTLIIAFPVCWAGFFSVLAGKPVKPGTHTQPAWWLIGMYAGCFFALVAGIIAAVVIAE